MLLLVCGNRVRLSDRDKRLLRRASRGGSVDHIHTVEQLSDFIHTTQQLYTGNSTEEVKIRGLLQRFIPDASQQTHDEENVLHLTHI